MNASGLVRPRGDADAQRGGGARGARRPRDHRRRGAHAQRGTRANTTSRRSPRRFESHGPARSSRPGPRRSPPRGASARTSTGSRSSCSRWRSANRAVRKAGTQGACPAAHVRHERSLTASQLDGGSDPMVRGAIPSSPLLSPPMTPGATPLASERSSRNGQIQGRAGHSLRVNLSQNHQIRVVHHDQRLLSCSQSVPPRTPTTVTPKELHPS